MVTDFVEKILSIVEEARIRKYSEFILEYDLRKAVNDLTHDIASGYINDYQDGYDSGYEEAKEESYEDAYDNGKREGIYEERKAFINILADKIIELKQKIKDKNLQGEDLQIALTEMLLELDEDDNLSYTQRMDHLNYIDETL